MIKKVVTMSYLSAAALPRINYGDCADKLPQEHVRGRRPCVVVCCVCVVMMCCRVASCFVCLFCEVAVYFFLRLYDMELVLTLCVGARYYLNSKQDI